MSRGASHTQRTCRVPKEADKCKTKRNKSTNHVADGDHGVGAHEVDGRVQLVAARGAQHVLDHCTQPTSKNMRTAK